MGKSTPAPVDYEGAALAEGEAARRVTEAQTWANRPNQINPWGSLTWSPQQMWDPSTEQYVNQWTQTQDLSPALDTALSNQMGLMAGRSQLGYGMMGNIAQDLGRPMDWSYYGAPEMVGTQHRMSNVDMPDLWGHLQWDIPSYETTGTLRDINYEGAPDVMAPQFGLQRAEDAIYGRGASRLDPQQAAEQQALEIKLRNQGLTEGDAGYKSAMQDMNMRHNDARQALINESIMGGGREAQRLLGMEQGYRGQYTDELMQAAQFGNQASQQEFMQRMMAGQQGFADTRAAAEFQNQARQQLLNERMGMMGYNQNLDFRMTDYWNNLRQQMINEQIMRRGQGLNEANALISGQQVGLPQFAGFSQAQRADTPQLLAAANMTGQQNAAIASAENQAIQGLMGGLGQGLGMMGMFSDKRLKSNIHKIGQHNGVNWYAYDIFGRREVGVMAQEVPWAAFEHPSGYLMVDYSRI